VRLNCLTSTCETQEMTSTEPLTSLRYGTETDLETLDLLITKCASISGTKERCEVFKKYAANIKPLIAQIYDPYQKFHVTSSNIVKYEKKKSFVEVGQHKDLTELLTDLTEKKISGHEALNACLTFIKKHEKYRDTILKALNKDLKIRVGVSLVNSAFPMLVPTFSCALSLPLEKQEKFYEKNRKDFFISRKLDGCRCIFVCDKGKVIAYSRSGHVYPESIQGLSYFLEKFQNISGVLDGEMGVVDKTGKEYFNIANALMNPNAVAGPKSDKNMQLLPDQYLCYFAFDLIPLETFKNSEGPPVFLKRQQDLQSALKDLVNDRIKILPQESSMKMDDLWQEAESKGWEGLMLRKNTDYDGKKSRNMLKRKRQDDEEFMIEEATSCMQMGPNSTDSELALEHVGIRYKENRVWVGSGFTWEQRQFYAKNPDQLKGMYITVCHNGESKNKKGEFSLRHPRVKALYEKSGRQN